ncbi:MAG TPA: ACP S-malonyltransferase [Streptosporangiaceae bacterium]|nr:ACP S-malonyltransferase [Streptosporangiaceae bacterium]
MLVIAAPGQGAQTAGFLAPWLEVPGVAEQVAAWSDLAGCDLIRYGTVAAADEIRNTAVAQPLLVASALAAAGVLGVGPALTGEYLPGTPNGTGGGAAASHGHHGGVTVGHSVGELAAGAIGGILSADDALRLVGIRGRAMAQAAAAEPTSMTAVLGGDEKTVLAAIEAHGLTPANINASGQVVAAGTVAQLAAFAADPPAGARLRPLQVAGAFHTEHMAPAVDALRAASAGVEVHDPVLTVLSNRDGAAVRSGTDWLDRIVTQVSAPVRWDRCMHTMSRLGVTAFIELPPAGTLVGLARRALPGVALLAVKTPADVDEARALFAEHANSHANSHAPEWRRRSGEPGPAAGQAPAGRAGVSGPA